MEYPLTFEQFQEGLVQGKLLGLHCRSCGAYTVPPQGVCQNCGGRSLEPAEMAGEGIIRTFTVIRVAPEGRIPPYILIMVELGQGPWVLGRLSGVDPEKTEFSLMGKRVFLDILSGSQNTEVAGLALLFFRLAKVDP